ncbi:MAG: DNA primase noncatalytic subunit PriX [Nitrososphaeraceae archaeon]
MKQQKIETEKAISPSKNLQTSSKDFENGFAFILNHFKQDKLIFPRKIMTKKLGCQIEVLSEEEALQYFYESQFIDCRINAFPSFTAYKGIQRYPPDFIFIDVDRNNFDTERGFDIAFSRTLKNLKIKLDGHPTVLFTGGGYHIYQPIDSFVLEEIKDFTDLTIKPSIDFIRFAKDYFSNRKADKLNNPSFKSCLLRIPFSFNSKYFSNEDYINYSEVKIIQEWDKKRPSIKHLLFDFRRYLINEKIKKWKSEQKFAKRPAYNRKYSMYNISGNNSIWWIEKLLNLPIFEFRKNATNLILAPYLIVIKKLSYSESFEILNKWLGECNAERQLDFNSCRFVKNALNTALSEGIPPMKLETLKKKDTQLYFKLTR